MGFRTVVISSHSKLEFSMNYLVFKTIDEVKRINISEIQTVIIESTAVCVTSALLSELIKHKIKVVFCDEKRNPISELVPYYGDCISYKRINEQINWNDDIKSKVWKIIIEEKIKQQARVLSKKNKEEGNTLLSFANEVIDGDTTNREGHAAKYYFNRVFGDSFTRNKEDKINKFLNYGYTLILSQFNRCIVSKGYITQLGIHHKNEFNQLNLSCDLMEPFRPFIDERVESLTEENFKDELVKILGSIFLIDGQKQTLANAIGLYCSSVFSALNTGNLNKIKFISNYE